MNRAKKRENDNRMRGEVIVQIRAKVAEGKNHSEIARDLNLKRLGVRYVVKKIQEGKTLRGETVKPVEVWEDMPEKERAAEAIPHYGEKFKL